MDDFIAPTLFEPEEQFAVGQPVPRAEDPVRSPIGTTLPRAGRKAGRRGGCAAAASAIISN
jgi:hypothetical protein